MSHVFLVCRDLFEILQEALCVNGHRSSLRVPQPSRNLAGFHKRRYLVGRMCGHGHHTHCVNGDRSPFCVPQPSQSFARFHKTRFVGCVCVIMAMDCPLLFQTLRQPDHLTYLRVSGQSVNVKLFHLSPISFLCTVTSSRH